MMARRLQLILIVTLSSLSAAANSGPYDPDPNHLWNRLHRAIFIRTAGDGTQFGEDAVDPLLYADGKFLRTGDSHKVLLETLTEFLAAAPERHINDPLK